MRTILPKGTLGAISPTSARSRMLCLSSTATASAVATPVMPRNSRADFTIRNGYSSNFTSRLAGCGVVQVRSFSRNLRVQVARNRADRVDGFLRDAQWLILDRDTKFTEQFRRILDEAGVGVVTTDFQAPNMNAIAERFVG